MLGPEAIPPPVSLTQDALGQVVVGASESWVTSWRVAQGDLAGLGGRDPCELWG